MRQEYGRMCEYKQYDVEALRSKLDGLKRSVSDAEYEMMHFHLINQISMFLRKGGPVDEAVLTALGYVRESEEYSNIEKDVHNGRYREYPRFIR